MSSFNWSAQDYIYVTAECLTGVLSVLGNILVLLAIGKTRALQTITNCFIGSLAAADVLVGFLVPPTVILPYRGLPSNFHGCVLLNTVVVLITNISILSLLAVALERFLAISDPFRYQRLMTVRRAMAVVVVTWIVAIFIGLVPTMGWNLGTEGFKECSFLQVIDMRFMIYLIFFGVTLPPLFFMLAIYIYIFHIIRKQQRAVMHLTVLSASEQRNAQKQKREVRGAKGLAYVIVLFVVCWMPIHILNCISFFAPERSAPLPWLLLAIVLSHANSFVNPFLYAFSNTQFKRAMFNIIFCGRECNGTRNINTTDENSRGILPRVRENLNTVWPNINDRPRNAVGDIPNDVEVTTESNKKSSKNGHRLEDGSTQNDRMVGVVNKAFNEDPKDVKEEETPRTSALKRKSLKWCKVEQPIVDVNIKASSMESQQLGNGIHTCHSAMSSVGNTRILTTIAVGYDTLPVPQSEQVAVRRSL